MNHDFRQTRDRSLPRLLSGQVAPELTRETEGDVVVGFWLLAALEGRDSVLQPSAIALAANGLAPPLFVHVQGAGSFGTN